MKLNLILVAALMVAVFNLNAQAPPYTFKVIVSKGKTEIKAASAWQSIKVGASLKASDEVKIAEGSYLGLIHANGKPLEIRESGSFKVSELVSRMGNGSSVLNKYTDFILSSDQEKSNKLSATGAVHRGMKDVIIVYLSGAERAELYGNKLGVQWASDEVKGPYEVVFTTLLEDELARYTVNENELLVDMNDAGLRDEYEIQVKVVAKGNPGKGSKEYIIKRLRPADRVKFTKIMDEIKASVEQETALSKYYLAGIYEENLLLNDAITAYQEAIKLAPDVPLYKDAYDQFLTRLGLK